MAHEHGVCALELLKCRRLIAAWTWEPKWRRLHIVALLAGVSWGLEGQ